MSAQILEGTWEEITRYASELSGKRVRLTVLSDEVSVDEAQQETLDKMLAGLTGAVQSNGGKGGSRLSECTGADFAEDLVLKHRKGQR